MKVSLDWKSQQDVSDNHLEANIYSSESDEEVLKKFKLLLETMRRYESAKE